MGGWEKISSEKKKVCRRRLWFLLCREVGTVGLLQHCERDRRFCFGPGRPSPVLEFVKRYFEIPSGDFGARSDSAISLVSYFSCGT